MSQTSSESNHEYSNFYPPHDKPRPTNWCRPLSWRGRHIIICLCRSVGTPSAVNQWEGSPPTTADRPVQGRCADVCRHTPVSACARGELAFDSSNRELELQRLRAPRLGRCDFRLPLQPIRFSFRVTHKPPGTHLNLMLNGKWGTRQRGWLKFDCGEKTTCFGEGFIVLGRRI